MKIVTIVGARPQFIKAAVVSRAFASHKDCEEVIVHTGQHFDENMSDVFFEEMAIPKPHYNLNINGLGHGAMTGQMLEGIEKILQAEQPDWVLVYGDTNSTLAGALAAKKLHIKLAHVEAGLRSFNMDMPEEINRILTDRISDILFCPTNQAVENLRHEGYENLHCRILKCGDVMQDAALFYASKSRMPQVAIPDKFILCTLHRAENTDDPKRLSNIVRALETLSETTKVVIPLHPRTKAKLENMNYDFEHSPILFISPVGYLEMVELLKNCLLVMTDSGGLQKEAYLFRKYCVTLRDETEWVELVANGYNILAGSDTKTILEDATNLLQRGKMEANDALYGSGDAGNFIVESLT
ncbi:MAG: UDP-N-acetylglucosamine 2-epimerase (non-hydrolyzing) [Paludibacteraceae bacterium]|jgi:UDP-GlcNAc3NAcA epimerase|nr:UDP-N-acetylglucosamine 2-epimerase (non-hydrolyzing) [Paludibacteraceae bacterium]